MMTQQQQLESLLIQRGFRSRTGPASLQPQVTLGMKRSFQGSGSGALEKRQMKEKDWNDI
jgi:hypothetical protein